MVKAMARPVETVEIPKWEDTYVLLRERRMASLPFVRGWVARHALSCGFRPDHAARFERVLVVGEPAGLDLEGCDVAYVGEEDAEVLLRRDPTVVSFFGRFHDHHGE